MTNQQHPITPPPELVKQWVSLACEYEGNDTWIDLATEAARWGADQELEACCEWLSREVGSGWGLGAQLRAIRRPKPPSLKEQALQALDYVPGQGADPACLRVWADREAASLVDTVRRALEQLDD